MIDHLPEKWRTPSIVSLIIQVAQILPLSFIAIKVCCKRALYQHFVSVLLVVSLFSAYLLAWFWNETAQIGAESRSVGLYILCFTSAVVGLMSFCQVHAPKTRTNLMPHILDFKVRYMLMIHLRF